MRPWDYHADRRWVLMGGAAWGTPVPPASRIHILPDGDGSRIDGLTTPPIPYFVTYCRSRPSGGLRIMKVGEGRIAQSEDRICLHCLSMAVFWGKKIAEFKGGSVVSPIIEPKNGESEEQAAKVRDALDLANAVQGIGVQEMTRAILMLDRGVSNALRSIIAQVDRTQNLDRLIAEAIKAGVVDPEGDQG